MDSGDRITVETYTGFYLYDQLDQTPADFWTPELKEICRSLGNDRKVGPGPHLLTGPIYIRDAVPGDVLEVRLEDITPSRSIGFNVMNPGKGALPQQFDQPAVRFIELDLPNGKAEFPSNSGIYVPLQPFFGILGVATETSINSVPPGEYGGNMDNRHLLAGSRLFLPIVQPGALFSIGDGHSAQGDGEVNLTAIETSMNGTIQLNVYKGCSALPLPFAETPTHWVTMGFAPTLDAAFEQALQKMLLLLEQFLAMSAEEAYVLCSLAVHFHITQAVNVPSKGVHGLLPKAILPRSPSYNGEITMPLLSKL
ncbi:MAG: acetamidase/formamidase family protein [Elainellaceae cyanobacterium]